MMENGKWKVVNGEAHPAHIFTFSIFHFPFFILIALACGCTPKTPPTKAPYVGPTQTLDEVAQAINRNNTRLPTLWASMKRMEASIVDDHGKRQDEVLGGTLLYRAPGEVKVVGHHDVAGDVVEIGSNKEVYWLAVRKGPDTAWWGRYKYIGEPCAQPIPIRPDLVLQVLGISTINTDFNALPVPVMRFNNDSDCYMMIWNAHLPDRWVAMKEVWYDRETKRPTRVFLFDLDGRIVLSAKLGQHRGVEVPGVAKEQWPTIATDYQLLFPDSGSRLHIVLDQLKLSRPLGHDLAAPNDATFRFDPHTAGTSKVIQLDEDCGR